MNFSLRSASVAMARRLRGAANRIYGVFMATTPFIFAIFVAAMLDITATSIQPVIGLAGLAVGMIAVGAGLMRIALKKRNIFAEWTVFMTVITWAAFISILMWMVYRVPRSWIEGSGYAIVIPFFIAFMWGVGVSYGGYWVGDRLALLACRRRSSAS